MSIFEKSRKTRIVSLMVGAVLAATLTGCGSGSTDNESGPSTLTFGDIKGGTGDITWAYIQKHKLEQKYGLELKRVANPVATLYTDFAAKRYPISIGTAEGFATLAANGVPIRMLSVNGVAADFLIAKKDLKVPEDLKGAKIAGVTGSGSYKSFAASLFKSTGFDVQKDAEVIPAQDNLAAVSQLLAGSVDAAFAWEADLSTALVDHPELKVVYSAADAYKEAFGATKWSTSFAYRTDADLDPKLLKKFFSLVAEAHQGLEKDPAATDALAQELIHSKPGALKLAFTSGRLKFDPQLFDGKVSEDVRKQLSIGQSYGTVPDSVPDSFFEPIP